MEGIVSEAYAFLVCTADNYWPGETGRVISSFPGL